MAGLQHCLPMSMQLLNSAAVFQLRIYPVACSTTMLVPRMPGPGSLVTGGGESARAAAANCASAPRGEEMHRAWPHPETQMLETGSHLLLANHSWISPSHKASEGCARSLGTLCHKKIWDIAPMHKKVLAIVKKDLLSLKTRHVCKDEGNRKGPETTV